MIGIRRNQPRNARSMTRTVGRLALVPALIVAWGVVVTTARADSLVPTGTPAPALALPTLAGETIRLADLKGRVVLLLFGELYNSNSVAACRDLVEITAQPATAGLELSAYLIVTQKAPAAELLLVGRHRNWEMTCTL